MEKNIEDSIKDKLIITATTTGIFYVLKTAKVKPANASLHAMDIMKLACGIVGGTLVKDYAVYQKMDQRVIQRQNFMAPKGQ